MRANGITFGGRVFCSFPRPNLVSAGVYEQIRGVCRGIFRAVEKVDRALGAGLWDLVDLTPEERELVAIDAGYRRASPLSRLDSFLTTSAYQFVELNAETPAGGAYAEALADVFLELPVIRKFQERYALRRFRTQERLLETLVGCYREAGGKAEHPTIAVVDYEDVPTRTEHHLVARYFESKGCPALVCDPRHLTYEGGRLRHDGRAIDMVYKRLLVNEFLERRAQVQALYEAARDRAVVMVNPFRCKPIHKKAIFAVLTDDDLQKQFTAEERAAIRAHVPWTRRVQEGKTTRDGETLDLPAWIIANRERLVMKPNDEYGGKGVFIGWEMLARGMGAGARRGPPRFLRGAGEGRAAPADLPRARPRAALPRFRGGPGPLRVRRRGRGLPDPSLRDVARERDLRRRPGAGVRGRATGLRLAPPTSPALPSYPFQNELLLARTHRRVGS